MMKHAWTLSSFFAEGIYTACYIRNRRVTKTNMPSVMRMKVFGCKNPIYVIISRNVKFVDEKGFNDSFEDFYKPEDDDDIEIECELDSKETLDGVKSEKRGRGRPKI